MSIPPSNQPPYGNPPYGNQPPYGTPPNTPPGGYYPAQPPKPSSGVNGWKIAGFGCLGLFLLAAIGGVILVRNVKNSISHPSKNNIVGMAVLAGQASLDGTHIQQAIVAYHAKHNAYPNTLMDLCTDGAIGDGKLLHNALDDSDDPAHISWRYYPPAEGAPGNTPILEEPYHITISNSTAPGKIVIDLDGKTESGQRQNSYGNQGNDGGQGNDRNQGTSGQGSNGGG